MIYNVIDRRKRPYRWKEITAIIEPTHQDNGVADSDQAEEPASGYDIYDERPTISLAAAVEWASSLPYPVTLYLYDHGHGINTVPL